MQRDATGVDGAPWACLHQLVARQAASVPDAIAVDSATGSLTYGELDARSDELATALAARGVGPGDLVALLAGRTPAMIAALLGILKAGAAYLPLDPSHPTARLAFILEDAGAAVVLADRASAPALPASAPPVAWLDGPAQAAPATGRRQAGDPGSIAYVIYTSGSTGRPKGVEVTHLGLLNYLFAMRDIAQFGADDAVAASSTIAFDIAGMEVWLPLLVGGRIALFTREEASDGRLLGRLFSERRVTLAQGTPATWRLLLEAGWKGDDRLTVFCGGEEMPRELAERLLPRCKALWNLYGPTETTVCSLAYRVTTGTGPVPIGRPIANTTVHVLDEQRHPVAAGEEGELYIGGLGVARGYRNRPDLTAERFLPDSTAHGSCGRLYRTGDIVRALPDGSLVFVGRKDQQLKIRGFRIEAGEVEAALLSDPAIRQAAVVAAREADGGLALAAHLVAREGARVDRSALRARARRVLPEYMIPTQIVVHPSLPLTPNGKIDRSALGAAVSEAALGPHVPPRNEVERAMAAIWEDLLQVRPVSVTADFFDLGGHSLLAAALFAEIARRFRVELPTTALVDTPTIEGLAARLSHADPGSWDTLVPIRTGGSRPPLFFVHGGGGTVLFLRDLAAALPSGRPVYGLQSEGLDGRRMAHWRVEEMAARYIEAIRRVQPRGPHCLAGYCFGALVAFEMARQLRAAGEEPSAVVLVTPPRARAAAVPAPACYDGACGSGRGAAVNSRGRRATASGRAAELLSRLSRHPSPAAVVGAVGDGIAWRWRELSARHPLTTFVVRALHSALSLGGRIPPAWRPAYVNAMTERSERAYAPRRFDGPLHVVTGAGLGGDEDAGWGACAASVKACRIGGTERLRRDLIKPPAVWELADKLAGLLTE